MNKPYNKPKQKPTRKITPKPRNPDQTQDLTDTRTPDRMHSAPKDGSPTTRPCTNIGSSETANEESLSEMIPVADDGGETVPLRSALLSLTRPARSREMHIYNWGISDVGIRRMNQHGYAIPLTMLSPRGGVDAD